jgi:protein-S-isoprenylcysteine O-methyltransferase Ste14
VLISGAPLFQYPITILGRRLLDAQPVIKRTQWTNIFVHYAMMIALGVSIFPAIRMVQQQAGTLPIPQQVGQALVWLTGIATFLTVLNLALRGVGAPFAAKLSSRLATNWIYAWTRNPMLLCTLALLLSVGLRYRSTWFVLWVILIVSPVWIYFVRIFCTLVTASSGVLGPQSQDRTRRFTNSLFCDRPKQKLFRARCAQSCQRPTDPPSTAR